MQIRTIHLLTLLALLVSLLAAGCAQPSKTVVVTPPQYDTAKAIKLAEQALAAQRNDDLEKAIALYKQSIEANPELSGVWTNLGVALMARQNFSGAAEAFKKAGDLSPTDSRPLINLGVAYLDRGWADEALSWFQRALERDPNNVEALRGAIMASQRLGREDEKTLEYIKRLQLVETDVRWKQELAFRRVRIEHSLRESNRGTPVPARQANPQPNSQPNPQTSPPGIPQLNPQLNPNPGANPAPRPMPNAAPGGQG